MIDKKEKEQRAQAIPLSVFNEMKAFCNEKNFVIKWFIAEAIRFHIDRYKNERK